MGKIDAWVTQLGQAWVEQDPDKAMALVDRNHIEWYENPLDPPATTWNDVHQFWINVPHNQREVSFSHHILMANDYEGVAEWQATLTKVPSQKVLEISGIFHIKINDDGLCVYFKQWEAERFRDEV